MTLSNLQAGILAAPSSSRIADFGAVVDWFKNQPGVSEGDTLIYRRHLLLSAALTLNPAVRMPAALEFCSLAGLEGLESRGIHLDGFWPVSETVNLIVRANQPKDMDALLYILRSFTRGGGSILKVFEATSCRAYLMRHKSSLLKLLSESGYVEIAAALSGEVGLVQEIFKVDD